MLSNAHIACIALGSNLGDREAMIEFALRRLDELPGVRVIAVSPIIETEPVSKVAQGPYLNAAVMIETTRSPRELHAAMAAIETQAGRDRAREERWGPRTLDLDLLVQGDLIIDEPGLTVPHPRMHERLFVLEPLAAIAPQMVHPLLGRTVEELRQQLLETEASMIDLRSIRRAPNANSIP